MFTLCRQPQSSNFHLRVVLTFIVLASQIATPIVPLNTVSASIGNSYVITEQESVPETPEEFGQLPLQFELNQGQTDPQVQFLTRASGATVFLKSDETTFLLSEAKSQDRNDETTKEVRTRKHALRMKINNSNATARLEGVDRLPGDANYLIGNDPSKWHTHIPTFSRLKLQDAYPGVDLVYYGTRGQLEYDFVVRPGVDAEQVSLTFEGANAMKVESSTGDLLIETSVGNLRQRKPFVYQEANGERIEIQSTYEQKGLNHFGFRIGTYDRSKPLVIDPVIVYSTFLGGNLGDSGTGIALDQTGNVYVTGNTDSPNFPTTVGAFDTTANGEGDVFITKLNSAGSARIYSTYLGGSSGEIATSIAVDPFGYAHITGNTRSANFPTKNAAQATAGGSNDVFITRLHTSGSLLEFSTYLGGTFGDFGNAIVLDATSNSFVVGGTSSSNFPTTAGALDRTLGGNTDVFVTKISSGGTVLYSTFVGGAASDNGDGAATDGTGSVYFTGRTAGGFPTTANVAQPTLGGNEDALVGKLNASGSALVYATYLGGSLLDVGSDIAVDFSGNAYVVGRTSSLDFPTANAVQPTRNGSGDAFIAKLNATGGLIYSTYLGGTFNQTLAEFASAVAIDPFGNAYVAGSTTAIDFPTTSGNLQEKYGGNTDGFVTKFSSNGSVIAYSIFIGGSQRDDATDIAVDAIGNAYITGLTNSADFPTANAIQPAPGDTTPADAFVAKLMIVNHSIAGRVIDNSGNGISSVTITLSGSTAGVTTTDSTGRFIFPTVPPNGEYNVTPVKQGTIFSPDSIHIFDLDDNRNLLFVASTNGASTGSSTFQFSASSFSITENGGSQQIIVTRSGDISQPASVDYATTDGTANDRGDYTTAIGRLRFAAGESAKSFKLFITDDVYQEGNETINIALTDPSAGSQVNATPNVVLTIVDNDLVNGTDNPIDRTDFFVRQHYIDFLNREPDPTGLSFWSNNIESCGNNAQCRELKRIDTSAAFFFSIEFQQTGFLVERMYRAAFNRFPRYRELLRDSQEIGRDLIVGQAGWEAKLSANQQQFTTDFVSRADFLAIYSGLSNAQYVDALNSNANGSLSTTERDQLLAGLNALTETRATVLKKVAEDPDFVSREFNRGFVLMEFVGYLRRNPDDAPDGNFNGFNFWLSKLDQFGGDYRQAEMVKAFLSSSEYRARFSQF